ncbi:hypothetical protein ACLB2K_057063 [Fragaria x ananassa]
MDCPRVTDDYDRFSKKVPWKRGELAMDKYTGEAVFMRLFEKTSLEGVIFHRGVCDRAQAVANVLYSHKPQELLGVVAGGEDGEWLYWVTPFIENDLSDYLSARRNVQFENNLILQRLLESLIKLKELGLFHGNLRPGNILMEQFEGAISGIYLGGLEWAREEEDGFLVKWPTATKNYMAPELILGNRRTVTGAVDVWACGCIYGKKISLSLSLSPLSWS